MFSFLFLEAGDPSPVTGEHANVYISKKETGSDLCVGVGVH